jgi:ankyrin repeat protein
MMYVYDDKPPPPPQPPMASLPPPQQESKVGSLLSRGGEVDVLDSGGATPLMLACHQGNPQLGEKRERKRERGGG